MELNTVLAGAFGCVGAIVGALVGGWMSRRVALETTAHNFELLKKLDRERESEGRREQRRAIYLDFIGEMDSNLGIVGTGGDHWIIPLASQAWDAHRGSLFTCFDAEDRSRLRDVYTQVSRINSLLATAHDPGSVSGTVKNYKDQLKEDLQDVFGDLRERMELGTWDRG